MNLARTRLVCVSIVVALALLAKADLSAQVSYNVNYDIIRNSVVFIHLVDSSGIVRDSGTGFLLSIPTKSDPKKGYLLLVTARHIADPNWLGCPDLHYTLTVILNKKKFDPKTDESGIIGVPIIIGNWMFPDDDSVDIAMVPINGQAFQSLDVANTSILVSQLPSDDELKKVDSGWQVVSAGLIAGASGTKRNYPIFKFGYISSIPEEKVPVASCAGSKFETVWMVAASLVPGNSGSPIIYAPPPYAGTRAFLLGVQSSSFLGYDIAGMAPVRYLIDMLRKLGFPDADLGSIANPNGTPPATAKPTSSQQTIPVPALIKKP